jgi:hypothetical protein
MIHQFCSSPILDADPLQLVRRSFSSDSKLCLLDSSLPQPWHCPFAVCPQKFFVELQPLFALQEDVVVKQESSVAGQWSSLVKQ